MKKVRKVVIAFMAIWMVICFAGCSGEISDDSDDYAMVWCNDECVSIYSPVASIVDLEVEVEYSGKTITVVKQVEVQKAENKVIMVQELNEELFDEESKIVSAEVIKQQKQESEDDGSSILLLLLLFVVIFAGTLLLAG